MTQDEKLDFLLRRLLAERKEYADIRVPDARSRKRGLLRSLMNVRPPVPASAEFLAVQDAYLQERLAERGITRLQDLTPVQEEAEEFQITDELCEEAFREGLAVKDFSVAFLQRRFRLKYIDACNLQDKLRQDGKIKRAFLVGDTVCKG